MNEWLEGVGGSGYYYIADAAAEIVLEEDVLLSICYCC